MNTLKDNSQRQQGHNLTHQQKNELHLAQLNGEAPFMTASDGVTQIPEAEKHLVHFTSQIVEFDGKTGKPKFEPRKQVVSVRDFKLMEDTKTFLGMKVVILHMPASKSEQVAAKLNTKAATNTSTEMEKWPKAPAAKNINLDKPLDRMNKEELNAKYENVFGEPVPANIATDLPALRTAIINKVTSDLEASLNTDKVQKENDDLTTA